MSHAYHVRLDGLTSGLTGLLAPAQPMLRDADSA
jgi:hypothetical protein